MSTKKLVDYAKEAAKVDSKSKKVHVPKVKNCRYANCPLRATTAINGQYACSFHDTAQFHGDVTLAIRNNKTFIQNYNTMVHMGVKDWQKAKKRLLNHPSVPMNEGESPSMYLVRFFNFIEQKIKNEASEMIIRRKNNYPGGFEDEEI